MGRQSETAVSEVRGAICMQDAKLETIRNGFAIIDKRAEHVPQFGSKTIAKLDAIMTAFRAEIIVNKSGK